MCSFAKRLYIFPVSPVILDAFVPCQAVQEDMIDKWKLILQDVQKSCNHAGQRCQEMQAKIESSVSAVKAAEEYVKFTEQNKTAPPSPVLFKFDQSQKSIAEVL